jgi:hypothetical protein
VTSRLVSKRGLRTLFIAVITTSTIGLAATPARAATVAEPASAPIASVQSAGSDNCAVAVGQRRGGWVCRLAGQTAVQGDRALAAAAMDGYCDNVWGCWYVINPHQAEFHSYQLANGKNGTVLGYSENYHVIWKTGSTTYNTSAQNAITLSSSSTHVVFSGSLFNGARNKVGSIISTCTPVLYKNGASAPAGSRIQSPTPYCLLADRRNYDHNMAAQLTFFLPGQSGYWYIYARSPVAHTSALGSFYTFSHSDVLPADRFGAGWKA